MLSVSLQLLYGVQRTLYIRKSLFNIQECCCQFFFSKTQVNKIKREQLLFHYVFLLYFVCMICTNFPRKNQIYQNVFSCLNHNSVDYMYD